MICRCFGKLDLSFRCPAVADPKPHNSSSRALLQLIISHSLRRARRRARTPTRATTRTAAPGWPATATRSRRWTRPDPARHQHPRRRPARTRKQSRPSSALFPLLSFSFPLSVLPECTLSSATAPSVRPGKRRTIRVSRPPPACHSSIARFPDLKTLP